MNANSKVDTWAEVWTLFEQRCATKRIKDSTMDKHRTISGRFVQWADDEGIVPFDLQPLDVIRYTGGLTCKDGKPFKTNTLRTHCRYLKTLLNFASDVKVIPERIKIEMPRAQDDEIKALNDEEFEAVLAYFDERSEGNPQDAAIVCLLKDSGVRASELLGLTWEDIEWDEERHVGRSTSPSSYWRTARLDLPRMANHEKPFSIRAPGNTYQRTRNLLAGWQSTVT